MEVIMQIGGAIIGLILIGLGLKRRRASAAPGPVLRNPDMSQENSASQRIVSVAGYPSFSELEWLARTIWGEARGETVFGMRAVGHVIVNRVIDTRFPVSVAQVVTAGNGSQFNVWRRSDPNFAKARDVTTADRQYSQSLDIARQIMSGQSIDPTEGAFIYFNQRAATNTRFVRDILGQVGSGQARRIDIGNHSFFPGAF